MSEKRNRKNKDEIKFDTHHRRPRSIGGDGSPKNLSEVPREKHIAWHRIFGNMTAQEIADEINKYWLDPSYSFYVHKKRPEPGDEDGGYVG